MTSYLNYIRFEKKLPIITKNPDNKLVCNIHEPKLISKRQPYLGSNLKHPSYLFLNYVSRLFFTVIEFLKNCIKQQNTIFWKIQYDI